MNSKTKMRLTIPNLGATKQANEKVKSKGMFRKKKKP
jgi:hypothetical protein